NTKILAEESGPRRVRPNLMFHQQPVIAVRHDNSGKNEVVWFSERDGWGHLYLYDGATGTCLRQITQGEFAISQLLRIDWSTRTIWASVAGLIAEDLYRESICRINLDTGAMEQITNDELD